MMHNELHSHRDAAIEDAAIEKRIDALLVNKAHRESARIRYCHAMATVGNAFEIVETLQRFTGTIRMAFLNRPVFKRAVICGMMLAVVLWFSTSVHADDDAAGSARLDAALQYVLQRAGFTGRIESTLETRLGRPIDPMLERRDTSLVAACSRWSAPGSLRRQLVASSLRFAIDRA